MAGSRSAHAGTLVLPQRGKTSLEVLVSLFAYKKHRRNHARSTKTHPALSRPQTSLSAAHHMLRGGKKDRASSIETFLAKGGLAKGVWGCFEWGVFLPSGHGSAFAYVWRGARQKPRANFPRWGKFASPREITPNTFGASP